MPKSAPILVIFDLLFLQISAFVGMTIGSESYYHEKVVPEADKAVSIVTEQFIMQCRLATPDRHAVRVIIDAGWLVVQRMHCYWN